MRLNIQSILTNQSNMDIFDCYKVPSHCFPLDNSLHQPNFLHDQHIAYSDMKILENKTKGTFSTRGKGYP